MKYLSIFQQESMKKYLLTYCCLFLFAQAIILVFAINDMRVEIKNINSIKEAREEKASYWMNAVAQYPTEPDVLYNASVASLNMGDKKAALGYLQKALHIDPLFVKANELREEIVRN